MYIHSSGVAEQLYRLQNFDYFEINIKININNILQVI